MSLKSELEENPYAPPIEEDYLQTSLEYRDAFDSDEDFREALAVWPKCAQCGRRRITRCPVCKTSGNLFPLGDSAFWNANADDQTQIEPVQSCCARRQNRHDEALYNNAETTAVMDGQIFPGLPSARCIAKTYEKTSDVFDELADERERVNSWEEAAEQGRGLLSNLSGEEGVVEAPTRDAPILVCHVCSEAFAPQFPKRCEWCNYEFETGIDEDAFDPDSDENGVADFLARKQDEYNEDDEANNARVVGTVLVLAAIIIGVFAYLAFL